MCAEASEALRVAQNKYNTLHDGKAAVAAKLTDKQVEDTKTVTVLATVMNAETPEPAACNVQGVDSLNKAKTRINENAAWYDTHTTDLTKAVEAVNKSHDAKTLQDARAALAEQVKAAQAKVKGSAGKVKDDTTRVQLQTLIDNASKTIDGTDAGTMGEQVKQLKDLMGKVDASVDAKSEADRKAAEEKARKEAEAQAAAQTQAPASQSYTPTYTAPATPQYTAPSVPQYTAPQQTAPVQPAQPAQPSKPNTGSGPVSGGHGCNEGDCSSTPDLGYILR